MIQLMRAFAVASLFTAAVTGTTVLADNHAKHAAAKAGDTVYACSCGAACPCNAMQATPGKCGCGKDLAKATVTKVDGDKVSVKFESGAEQVFTKK